jgi:hypothetical protein
MSRIGREVFVPVIGRCLDRTDVPMMAAMRRSGADPDAHPWHKWLYAATISGR